MERIWLKNYEPGVPHDIEIPDKTLPELMEETVNRFPDVIAAKFMGGTLTYRELYAEARRFAAALAALGFKPGTRVALNLPNCPQFMISYSGKAGCLPAISPGWMKTASSISLTGRKIWS